VDGDEHRRQRFPDRNFLADGTIHPGAIADPCAVFFEWDYAAINGLGFSHTLHVGDSTWFAGIMFDL
jgi:hypothetical protein